MEFLKNLFLVDVSVFEHKLHLSLPHTFPFTRFNMYLKLHKTQLLFCVVSIYVDLYISCFHCSSILTFGITVLLPLEHFSFSFGVCVLMNSSSYQHKNVYFFLHSCGLFPPIRNVQIGTFFQHFTGRTLHCLLLFLLRSQRVSLIVTPLMAIPLLPLLAALKLLFFFGLKV